MGLLQEWREYAYGVELNSKEGKAIWDKYFEQEKAIYQQLLAAPEKVVSTEKTANFLLVRLLVHAAIRLTTFHPCSIIPVFSAEVHTF